MSNSDRRSGGGAATDMLWIRDADASRTLVAFSGYAQADRAHARTEEVGRTPIAAIRSIYDNGTKRGSEQWGLSLEQRGYPWPRPLGWSLSLGGTGGYLQQWDSQTQDFTTVAPAEIRRFVSLSHHTYWSYRYSTNVDAVVGYGRVRDATAVLDVRVFEDRLRHAGALTRSLSPAARRRLVEIAYTQYAVGDTRDRPAKVVWTAIEQVLHDDGALAEAGVDPAAAMRAAEPYLGRAAGVTQSPFPESPVARLTGSFTGPVLSGWHRHDFTRNDEEYVDRQTLNDSLLSIDAGSFAGRDDRMEQDEIFAGIRSEYHRPLGLRWQVDASGQVVAPIKRHRRGWLEDIDAHLVTILADRWLAALQARHRRHIDRDGDAGGALLDDSWVLDYNAGATYYLQDRLQLDVSLGETQSSARSGATSSRRFVASLGLTYRIAGRLRVPGIGDFPPGAGASD